MRRSLRFIIAIWRRWPTQQPLRKLSADIADEKNRDPQTYEIIGAAMAVDNELGHGFLESVYQEAFAIEFNRCDIPFEREQRLPISYMGVTLENTYQADFVCFRKVIVELKAVSALESSHEAQVINYLKASGLERGLLINFGGSRLQFKRLILSVDSTTNSS